jgi:hypothetical protein
MVVFHRSYNAILNPGSSFGCKGDKLAIKEAWQEEAEKEAEPVEQATRHVGEESAASREGGPMHLEIYSKGSWPDLCLFSCVHCACIVQKLLFIYQQIRKVSMFSMATNQN